MKTQFAQLKGKTILVTGANGQLGRGLIILMAHRGARVIATDIQARSTFRLPRGVRYLKMDVTDEAGVREVEKQLGIIDVLVNNAGLAVFTPFEQRTMEEIRRVLDVNVLGSILCSKIFAENMRRRGRGAIINIASMYGVVPPDKRIYGKSGRNSSEVYGASKAAVIQLTRYLASYLGEFGIRVNAVSPGGIYNNQESGFVRQYVNKTPMGRMAAVHDVATVVAFLCSDDSAFVTGQNICVDGGFTLNY